MRSLTFGVVVGNRGFFPDLPVRDGRQQLLDLLTELGFHHVALSPGDSKLGAGETATSAKAGPRRGSWVSMYP